MKCDRRWWNDGRLQREICGYKIARLGVTYGATRATFDRLPGIDAIRDAYHRYFSKTNGGSVS